MLYTILVIPFSMKKKIVKTASITSRSPDYSNVSCASKYEESNDLQ